MIQLAANLFFGPNLYAPHPVVMMDVQDTGLQDITADVLLKRAANRLPAGGVWLTVQRALNRLAELQRSHDWSTVLAGLTVELQASHAITPLSTLTETMVEPIGKRIIVETDNPEVAPFAANAAFMITQLLFVPAPSAGEKEEATKTIQFLLSMVSKNQNDWNTSVILEAAARHDIPFFKTLANGPHFTLGQGVKSQRIHSSKADTSSNIGVEIASDKHFTKQLIRNYGLPIPEHRLITFAHELDGAIAEIGFPLVIKGRRGENGYSVTTNIRSKDEIKAAVEKAQRESESVLIERHVEGDDYRLTIVDGKMVAAARRLAARVIGDGTHTIDQLIQKENERRLGIGRFGDWLVPLSLDEDMLGMLARVDLTPDDAPGVGEIILLRNGSNVSQGGTTEDVTDIVHPDTVAMAENAARIVRIDIAGIDLIVPDITKPLGKDNGVVIEINAMPGLRPHYVTPTNPRDPADAIIGHLFPNGGRIPTVAVTGTNGKTTTCRMVRHILEQSGQTVGMSGTYGLSVAGTILRHGDDSGGFAARQLMQHPAVEAGVFEMGRGGLLSQGTVWDWCDVGMVTNVTYDHLFQNGLTTMEEIARVKRQIIERARHAAVLNADDALCRGMAAVATAPVWWVSQSPDQALVRNHLTNGGQAVVIEHEGSEELAVYHDGLDQTALFPINDLPCTLNGRARHNVENALFAAAAGLALGLPVETIRAALCAFVPSFDVSPGRLNIRDVDGMRLVCDFAHNEDGVKKLCQTFENDPISGRRVCLMTVPNNREDAFYARMAAAAAPHFERFYTCVLERPDNPRPVKEIAAVIKRTLTKNGVSESAVTPCKTQQKALDAILKILRSGDLFIAMGLEPENAWQHLDSYFDRADGKSSRSRKAS